ERRRLCPFPGPAASAAPAGRARLRDARAAPVPHRTGGADAPTTLLPDRLAPPPPPLAPFPRLPPLPDRLPRCAAGGRDALPATCHRRPLRRRPAPARPGRPGRLRHLLHRRLRPLPDARRRLSAL